MGYKLKETIVQAEAKTLGEYLKLSNKSPMSGISTDTMGMYITGIDIADANRQNYPFKAGDWVDMDTWKNNFVSVD